MFGICGSSPHPDPLPALRLSYSHILPGGCAADSVGLLSIRGSKPWLELNTDWGISTTSGWKKGGAFACGAGGAARLMYPPAGGNTRPGDSIHAFLAQCLGDGERDGGPCCGAPGCPRCGT